MIPPTTALGEKPAPDVHAILRDAVTCGLRFARVRHAQPLHDEHLLLVAMEDRIPFADALWQHGFRRRTPPGRPPVTYGRGRGGTLGSVILRVTSALRYGSRAPWLATREPEERILGRALTKDGIPVLAPQDEMVDILLHCLLDLDAFPSRYRDRLKTILALLRRHPPSSGAVAERVQRDLAPALEWGDVLACIEQDHWGTLLARRSRVRRHLFVADPTRSMLRLAWRLSGADRLTGHGVV